MSTNMNIILLLAACVIGVLYMLRRKARLRNED
jgi:hypothetical protein